MVVKLDRITFTGKINKSITLVLHSTKNNMNDFAFHWANIRGQPCLADVFTGMCHTLRSVGATNLFLIRESKSSRRHPHSHNTSAALCIKCLKCLCLGDVGSEACWQVRSTTMHGSLYGVLWGIINNRTNTRSDGEVVLGFELMMRFGFVRKGSETVSGEALNPQLFPSAWHVPLYKLWETNCVAMWWNLITQKIVFEQR